MPGAKVVRADVVVVQAFNTSELLSSDLEHEFAASARAPLVLLCSDACRERASPADSGEVEERVARRARRV